MNRDPLRVRDLLLLALASCAPGTADLADLALAPPGHWASLDSGAPAKPQDRWWKSFADAGLERIIHESLEGNLGLKASAERILQAASLARVAGAELWPEVTGVFRAGRARQVFVGFPIPGSSAPLSTTSQNFGVSLDSSWEIDLWGRVRAASGAGESDLEASRSEHRAAALSLVAQTAKSWFAVAEARAQVDLAEATVANRTATAELVGERYRRGLSPSLDQHLAESLLALAERQLEASRRLLVESRRQLELVLGRYPAGRIQGGSLPARLPESPPAGLPAQILDRRPDLVAARARLRAAKLRVNEAEASLYPRLSLTASGGTLSDRIADLLDGDFGVWNLLGNLVQPVFQGGRLRAQVDLASSRQREAVLAFANQVLAAFAEVERALTAERSLAMELRAAEKSLAELRAARLLAEERYRAGTTDILTLLDAERSAFDAESSVLSLRREALTNRVDLHLALGGGFGGERLAESEEHGEER